MHFRLPALREKRALRLLQNVPVYPPLREFFPACRAVRDLAQPLVAGETPIGQFVPHILLVRALVRKGCLFPALFAPVRRIRHLSARKLRLVYGENVLVQALRHPPLAVCERSQLTEREQPTLRAVPPRAYPKLVHRRRVPVCAEHQLSALAHKLLPRNGHALSHEREQLRKGTRERRGKLYLFRRVCNARAPVYREQFAAQRRALRGQIYLQLRFRACEQKQPAFPVAPARKPRKGEDLGPELRIRYAQKCVTVLQVHRLSVPARPVRGKAQNAAFRARLERGVQLPVRAAPCVRMQGIVSAEHGIRRIFQFFRFGIRFAAAAARRIVLRIVVPRALRPHAAPRARKALAHIPLQVVPERRDRLPVLRSAPRAKVHAFSRLRTSRGNRAFLVRNIAVPERRICLCMTVPAERTGVYLSARFRTRRRRDRAFVCVPRRGKGDRVPVPAFGTDVLLPPVLRARRRRDRAFVCVPRRGKGDPVAVPAFGTDVLLLPVLRACRRRDRACVFVPRCGEDPLALAAAHRTCTHREPVFRACRRADDALFSVRTRLALYVRLVICARAHVRAAFASPFAPRMPLRGRFHDIHFPADATLLRIHAARFAARFLCVHRLALAGAVFDVRLIVRAHAGMPARTVALPAPPRMPERFARLAPALAAVLACVDELSCLCARRRVLRAHMRVRAFQRTAAQTQRRKTQKDRRCGDPDALFHFLFPLVLFYDETRALPSVFFDFDCSRKHFFCLFSASVQGRLFLILVLAVKFYHSAPFLSIRLSIFVEIIPLRHNLGPKKRPPKRMANKYPPA